MRSRAFLLVSIPRIVHRLAVVLVAGTALVGAMGAAQETDVRPRLVLDGFSLVPPRDWPGQRAPTAVVFGKAIPAPEADPIEAVPQHTFVIMARLERAPEHHLAGPAALEQFVRERVLVPSQERRQALVASDTEPFTMHGTDCVRFRMTLEEQPRAEVLLIHGAGFVCRHPLSPGHAVHASYSERHVEGAVVRPTDAEVATAEEVFRSLAFTVPE